MGAMSVLGITQHNLDFFPQQLVTVKDTVSCPLDTVSCPTAEQDTVSCPIVSLKTQELTWDDFVQAVIYVESRGQDDAYHEKEKAAGCLQIRPIMVREVNRQLKKADVTIRFTLEDRWDRQKSIDMFDIIAEKVECCEDLTQMKFFEEVARKWNGGPRGHKKKSTQAYWERIKNQLNK